MQNGLAKRYWPCSKLNDVRAIVTKKEPPMKANGSGVFDDQLSASHRKVVQALQRRGYTSKEIAKATGLTEVDVKKVML